MRLHENNRSAKTYVTVNSKRIAITNWNKVLYPGDRFTKSDVIDYYVRISKYLLPHLKNRPVTLKRFPDGVFGEHFYEKDAPGFTPDWVRTFPVPRRGRTGEDIHYILINDLPTLVWLGNLANLEIHPFLHQAPRITRPTSVVFDCDPGEGADILTCARVALMLREVLMELGLESYVKVSGSKGLQVYVPFNSAVTYEETQPFAKALAELLEHRQPNLIVSKMSKALRKNKVFIDWSQNAESKTTVAVYSLRAKTHRPYVSLPVDWKELTAALKKNDANELFFTPEEALQRVEELGDLFQPVLKKVQKLPRELRQHFEHEPDRKVQLQNLPKARLEFIEPMLAMPVDRLPEKGDWFYELKFDGYRTLAVKNGSEVTLFSRRGNTLNKRFRRIAEAFDFLPDDTIVDGEVVVLDDTGKPSFSALQNSLRGNRSLYFYAFDLLAYQGKDVRKLPLSERRKVLEEYALADMRDPVRLSAVFNTTPRELVAAAKQNGLEGVVAKRASSSYQSGERSGAWMKYRTNRGQEFVIGGYKPDTVVFEYLLAGYYEGKDLIFIGKIKNGFTPALRRKVAEHFKGLETERCPFANLPESQNARRGEALTAEVMKKIRWLRPKLVAQIEFTEWTSNNHLRHSRFVALRDDKKPHEVTREFPQ